MMNREMKMKKGICLLMLAAMLVSAAGCESLPRKFVRKKKEPLHKPAAVYINEGAYQKQYSNDYYYKTHYTMWRTWHDELLTELGGNHRKVERAAQESLGHMRDMNKYLNAEKQAELSGIVDEFTKTVNRINGGNYSKSDEMSMKSDIEQIRRRIASNFYYEKVKDSLIADTVDLGATS